MSGEEKGRGGANGKGKKRKYLPHGKPVRKGLYPVRPGVQGFFLTCDGGREKQATNEALNLLDRFYEELLYEKNPEAASGMNHSKPLNKKITFDDSDSESDSGSSGEEDEKEEQTEPLKSGTDIQNSGEKTETVASTEQEKELVTPKNEEKDGEQIREENEESQPKKARVEIEKPIDELIAEELREMGDRKKRKFVALDSGCNGVIFIQMQKSEEDPNPVEIVQHMMNWAYTTKKHMSRFILRVLPVEIVCYASEEEIEKAIKPLFEKYFPEETSSPKKFAVLYDARANTGIDRMKIINAVAKSVPKPHKVDLSNPDKSIIVQIAKTNCMVGVVEKYKELSKFNLRQLTSQQ
ncbi:THUMP domain-containing protein 1 [Rhynchospora pubera]|uniref:THUMP domain-containing protein 1 n=1 Tax=Rhynchospora pubera TaxID=906938 RepID=A0AAV8GZB8_9POAL|nr:THUMP domain-containing protein 1 [Rhynchospora pubera]